VLKDKLLFPYTAKVGHNFNFWLSETYLLMYILHEHQYENTIIIYIL
jgi:hypothetical protein